MFEFFKDAMVKCYAETLAKVNPYEEASVDENSFYKEARAIVEGFIKAEKRDKYSAADVIQPTFKVMRGKALSVRDCGFAVEELLDIFECIEDCFPIYGDTELREKMVSGNITPVMKVGEHFIVDSFSVGKKSYLYINERIYKVVSKNQTVNAYKELLNDSETIYVQYRRPLKNGMESYYTKTVKKSKYSYAKLKKKDNIVGIFDKTSKYDIK